MKLLVVSDVHGDYDALEQAYRAEKNVGAVDVYKRQPL